MQIKQLSLSWVAKKFCAPRVLQLHATPFSLFEKDPRFVRKNIKMEKILEAGHFPWLEQISAVKKLFNSFVTESKFNLAHATIE